MKAAPKLSSREGWGRFLAQAAAFVEHMETDDLSALAAHVASLERRIVALEARELGEALMQDDTP